MNRSDIIRKALDTIVGEALIPEQLNPVLTELAYKLNPLLALLDKKLIAGNVYEFSQRTAFPSTSSIAGEKSNTRSGTSDYNQETVRLKILRLIGGVTGLQKASTRNFTDSYKDELVGIVEKISYDAENLVLYGNSDADSYQFSGFDHLLPLTSRDNGVGTISLDFLDFMFDRVLPKGARGDKLVWVMSTSMLSKVSSLQTQVLLTLKETEAFGGWRFTMYRNIPIVESSFCATSGLMTAISQSIQAGGALTDATTYGYRVSAVTSEGETVACANVDQATSSPNLTVRLTWTAFPDAIHYKIFRKTGAGTQTLLTSIAANTYDADGNITGQVTQFDDDGSYSENGAVLPLETDEENIFLIDLMPNKGCQIPYTNENATKNQIFTFEELGKIDDRQEFLVKSYLALAVRNPNLHRIGRNITVT